MIGKKLFSDKLAQKIWDQYFRRVRWFSKSINFKLQEELKLEIQDHLYESFTRETGESEAERLLNAIDRIGDPEEYIKPMIAEKLLVNASKTFNPKTIVKGLYYYIWGGVKKFFITILFGVGYIISFISGFLVVLKLFFPNTSGLLIHKNGGFALGIIDDIKDIKTDVLGYWIIPIGIILSVGIYLVLTRSSLRRLVKD